MRSKKTMIGVAAASASVLALMLASWATGAQAPVGSGKASATKSVCGLGTGKKATGAPIKIGGIDMLIPGVDFTTIGKVAKAYFDCVNDNGGIHGRPVKYILYNEQLNPAQEAALARKLIESDKVVGVVGNTSFAECGVNWKYYRSKGYVVIGAGVQAECYSSPSIVEEYVSLPSPSPSPSSSSNDLRICLIISSISIDSNCAASSLSLARSAAGVAEGPIVVRRSGPGDGNERDGGERSLDMVVGLRS